MQGFNSKTLNGNWFEDRCTSTFNKKDTANTYLPHPAINKYQTTTMDVGKAVPAGPIAPTATGEISKKEFFKSTDNWMSFQPDYDGTFNTTQRVDYSMPSDQKPKFQMKQTYLTKNPDALNEYREKYTHAGHNFSRTYLGDSTGFKGS